MPRSSNTWKPGQSGNPGGMTSEVRKLTAEARLAALKECPRIIKRFVECTEAGMTTSIDKQQFAIMRELLDRGMGKPIKANELTNDNPYEGVAPINMTNEQLKLAATDQVEKLVASLYADGQLEIILGRIKSE